MTDERGDFEALVTAEVVAEKLGLSKATVYRKVSQDQIPYHKIGHVVRFRLSEINEWIDQRASTADGES